LYRAIDSAGATIDFLLSALRDADAAKRLFRKALGYRSHLQPLPGIWRLGNAPVPLEHLDVEEASPEEVARLIDSMAR